MIVDPAKLAAFALVSGTTSLIPGPSMLFVLTQSVWRGPKSGATALAGLQMGYLLWWLLAALGLGTLAATFPLAFNLLVIGGALYLAWLGALALRHAGVTSGPSGPRMRQPTPHPLRDGIVVAVSNPKALVYMVALLPPFVDRHAAIAPQLAILALVAAAIDVALGAIYIAAGSKLAAAMERPGTRRWLDRVVGTVFILIALAILAELLWR